MDLSLKKPTISIISREQLGEKGIFLKRVVSLLKEGYSIKEALHFLLKIEKGETERWILSIQEGLLEGSSFHKELEVLGFSDKVCSQIYLANQYGDYGKTIVLCGEQLLQGLKKEKKFRSLAGYPAFLLLFLFGMLLLMRFLILPHMETLFMTTGADSNLYSNWIVQLVYYSPQLIFIGILLLLLIIIGLNYRFKNLTMIERLHIFTSIPFVKAYIKDYYSYFFFFEWGNLFQNGCSFQEIITIMQGEDASKLLKEVGEYLSGQMLLGKSINESLSSLPFFHREGLQVITHGENLGKLSTEMLVYASYCENQLELRVEKLMERLQPLIFIFIAIVILAIYAALMLPVFTLMEGFK